MAKRRICSFEIVVYKNGDNIEVGFNRAKKVPIKYGNFVASLEIGCLAYIQKIMKGANNGESVIKE